MKNIIHAISTVSLILFSAVAFSADAEYIGKIKSIYSHEREEGGTPYFGIELEGSMSKNPCGSDLGYFIKDPSKVSEQHMSMLLFAMASDKTVMIQNQQASEANKCFGAYPTFNMIKVIK